MKTIDDIFAGLIAVAIIGTIILMGMGLIEIVSECL